MFPLVILASLTDWEVRLLLVLILYRKSIRNTIGAVTFPTQHRHSFARSICTNQFVHYSIMELVLIKLFQQLEVSKIQNNTDYRVCSAGTCIKSFKWQYLNTSCNVQNGRRHNAQMNIHLTYNRINSWNEREIACTILRSGNTYSSTQNKRLIHKSGVDICVGFDIRCCVVYVTIAVVVVFLFLVFGIKLRARNKKEVYLNKSCSTEN